MTLERKFLSPEAKALFPLQTIPDLEKLFEIECVRKEDPNLTVFSIIFGLIETSLVQLDYSRNDVAVEGTAGRKSAGGGKRKRGKGKPSMTVEFKDGVQNGTGISNNNNNSEEQHVHQNQNGDGDTNDKDKITGEESCSSDKENVQGDFPPVELDLVEGLFLKFYDLLKTWVDLREFGIEGGFEIEDTPKELVKKVSDVVWSYLSRNYKADNPHIQTLYSYLTSKRLDSLGFTLSVTAGCQMLGLGDVHLVLSEDHSWVGFGGVNEKNCPNKTAEVTWHGKGIEDKRGQEVAPSGSDDEEAWLYMKGHGVLCSRHMEIAAMLASMHIFVNPVMISTELLRIQKSLLWKLYDAGHLKKYPMGLMTLADVEEWSPTASKPSCVLLHQEAISSTRTYHNDMHIYPYTTYAAYSFRKEDYKGALKLWAHAARIIQKYRRSKNDEEIYREFFEISTDFLATVMKSCSTGFSANSIVRDPMCFAHLLRFFDGICAWEERSRANIVHITWAKAWIGAIGKFDYTIRRLVKISEGTLENDTTHGTKDSLNGAFDDEKDSGIDEEDEPKPCVTFFSKKLRQLKDFFKLEKFNPSAITLILTAQTAVDDPVETEATNGTTGRSRRERRASQNSETKGQNPSDPAKGSARKRPRLSVC